MRADICDADNDAAIDKFRKVIQELGANLSEKDWALGVDVYRLAIGDQELTIYSDTWSIDIEGPDALVQRVLLGMEKKTS